ncbi:MAG: PASTA domain-containing protein, partial [Planctomycetaceae bacterium]|nr:PASTA domain-containing protein [Planctomycetaceae bacterium]
MPTLTCLRFSPLTFYRCVVIGLILPGPSAIAQADGLAVPNPQVDLTPPEQVVQVVHRFTTPAIESAVVPFTGDLVVHSTDISIRAGNVSCEFRRRFDPSLASEFPLPGWRSNWDRYVGRFGGVAMLDTEDQTLRFFWDPETLAYRSAIGDTLTFSDEGAVHETPDRKISKFDSSGQLVELEFPDGSLFSVTRGTDGLIQRVAGPFNVWIEFAYAADGRLQEVHGSDGSNVAFIYAGGIPATSGNPGAVTEYKYSKSGALTGIVHPSAQASSFVYDEQGRVARAACTDGTFIEYQYNDDPRRFIESHCDGSRSVSSWDGDRLRVVSSNARGFSSTATFTADGLLESFLDEHGSLTKVTYDDSQRVETIEIDGSVHRLEYSHAHRDPVAVIDDAGNRNEFTFDAREHLIGFRRNEERLISASWSSDGLLKSFKAWDRPSRRLTFDDDGRLTRIEQESGVNAELYYDGYGRISEVLDALGNSCRYRYDTQNRLTDFTDAAGNQTRWTYTLGPLPVSVRQPDGRELAIDYDDAGRLTRLTTDSDLSVELEYDVRGNLIRRLDGIETLFEYDDSRNLVRCTSPAGEWKFEYDEWGRRITERGPEGRTRDYAFDDESNQVAVTDGLGRTTRYEFDDRDRLVVVCDAAGRESRLSYHENGRLAAAIAPGGCRASITSDQFGRVLSILRDDTSIVRREYIGSRVSIASGPGDLIATFTYDDRNRNKTIHYPNGEWSVFGYDVMGRIASVTDALGRSWQTRYTPNGELESVRGPDSSVTRYRYDFEGRLTQIRDARGSTRTISYDARGRLQSKRDRFGRTTNLLWNEFGQLGGTQLPDGSEQKLSYDGLGRCVAMECTDGTKLTYEYDAEDNLIRESGPGCSASYRYDELDRIVEAAFEPSQQTVRSKYDAKGRRTSLEVVGVGTIQYEYDDCDRLVGVTDVNGRRTQFQYDETGRLARETFPNGVTVARSYDGRGRLLQFNAVKGEDLPLIGRRFAYDLAGNLVREVRQTGDQFSYEYDEHGRLSGWHLGLRGTAVSYDVNGNMIPQAGAEYDATDQLVRFDDEFFQFNEQGAMVERRRGDSNTRYEYDDRGCMTAVRRNGELIAEYAYDPAGRRIWKRIDDEETHFTYDGNQLVMETSASGEVIRLWSFGPHGHRPCMLTTDDETQYPLYDHSGSLVALVDATASVGAKVTYTPFGEVYLQEALHDSGPGFAGGYYDAETGLILFGLRYYDPQLRRFLTPDPVFGQLANPATLHPYHYALNNPLKSKDPTGASAAELDDRFADMAGGYGSTTGYEIGYGVGWLATSPDRAWSWETGNADGNERLIDVIDRCGRQVTGVAIDTFASTAIGFPSWPLDSGTGSGDASIDFQQGNYGQALLNGAGDLTAIGTPSLARLNPIRRPPNRLHAAYNNVDNILGAGLQGRKVSGNSATGRPWGLTEGQVYASVFPRDNWIGGLIKGRSPWPGDVPFVIVDESAGLFDNHDLDGACSLYKWMANQHKAGFGDLPIDQWYRNASGEVIVTKATLLDGLHQGPQLLGQLPEGGGLFSRVPPSLRLMGRRYGVDPALTGAVAETVTGAPHIDEVFERWLGPADQNPGGDERRDDDHLRKRLDELLDTSRRPDPKVSAALPPRAVQAEGKEDVPGPQLSTSASRSGNFAARFRRAAEDYINQQLYRLRDTIFKAADPDDGRSHFSDAERHYYARRLVEFLRDRPLEAQMWMDRFGPYRSKFEDAVRRLSDLEGKLQEFAAQHRRIQELLRQLRLELNKINPEDANRERIWQDLYPLAEEYARAVCSEDAGVYDSKEEAERARQRATKRINTLAKWIQTANEATRPSSEQSLGSVRELAAQLDSAHKEYSESIRHLNEYQDAYRKLQSTWRLARQGLFTDKLVSRYQADPLIQNCEHHLRGLLDGDESAAAKQIWEDVRALKPSLVENEERVRSWVERNRPLADQIQAAQAFERGLAGLSEGGGDSLASDVDTLQQEVEVLLAGAKQRLLRAEVDFFLDADNEEFYGLEVVARRNVLKAMQRMLECYNDIRWVEPPSDSGKDSDLFTEKDVEFYSGGGGGLTGKDKELWDFWHPGEKCTFARTVPKALAPLALPQWELPPLREGVVVVQEVPNTNPGSVNPTLSGAALDAPTPIADVGPQPTPIMQEAPDSIPSRPGSRTGARESPNQTDAGVKVPNLIGMKAEEVQKVLQNLGLRGNFKVGHASPSIANQFKAYQQDPTANTVVKKSAAVTVTLFAGAAGATKRPDTPNRPET